MAEKFQTVTEFLKKPFGYPVPVDKASKYSDSYNEYRGKIRIEAYTHYNKDYYVHMKVPSESKKDYYYDVIIRFFTTKGSVESQPHLRDYYIQFFSNSPAFMYQYAVLYKMNGYLIEPLYDKMDPDFIDKLPEKANKNMEMSYDKSIYFAVRYLSDNAFRYLSKLIMIYPKNKSPEDFFKGVSSFRDIKFDQEMLSAASRLEKSMVQHKRTLFNINRDRKDKMGRNQSITIKKKITSKKSTTGRTSNVVKKITSKKKT